MGRAHFSPGLFRFLRELKRNNRREWFQANQQRYLDEVREPLLQFVVDFAPRLRKISARFVADPRPVGGSVFRIHRDTRFSPDKTPYKTHAAAQFRHTAGKDVHAPGFYLHLEPGRVFVGAGLWRPDSATAARIRDAMVEHPEKWTRAVRGRTLDGDSLRRPPRGYPADHPLVEHLKRKDFITVADFDERAACSAGFLDRFTDACRASAPMMRFLAEALALGF